MPHGRSESTFLGGHLLRGPAIRREGILPDEHETLMTACFD